MLILHYNPRFVKRGKKTEIPFGFELECGNAKPPKSCIDRGYDNRKRITLSEQYKWLFFKHDCSVGFDTLEIVSHPITLGYLEKKQKDLTKLFSDLVRKNYSTKVTKNEGNVDIISSCGLHIHINNSEFVDNNHVYKFGYFIYKNKEFFHKISGRQEQIDDNVNYSHYARVLLDVDLNYYETNAIRYSTEIRHIGRYNGIDFHTEHRTTEIRFFAAKLSYEWIHDAYMTMKSLVDYTKITNKEDLSLPVFIGILKNNLTYKTMIKDIE